jgi:hypothetical protein
MTLQGSGGLMARVVACRCRTRLAARDADAAETVQSAAAVMWFGAAVGRRCPLAPGADGFRSIPAPEEIGTTL